MATGREFTIFTDENACPRPAEVKKQNRLPLGVLDHNNVPREPVPVKQSLKQSLKANVSHENEENLKEKPKTKETTLAPQPPKKDEGRREPFKCLDISMTSPCPLGSPMVVECEDGVQEKNEVCFDDEYFTEAYGDSHYAYMREVEVRLRARSDYMLKQKDISSTMRGVLVDWLVEVNEEYKMNDETLFLTVSLIDRFLSVMSVVRGKLQLVGTAAMFIASKFEEIYPPEISEFVYITDDTYTRQQIIRMEALMLKTLNFSVGGATSLAFVRRLAVQLKASVKVAHMAQYICELSMLTISSLEYRPSEVAASAIILALHSVTGQTTLWTEEMEDFTDVDSERVKPCVQMMHSILAEVPGSSHRAIPDKYSHKKLSCVSSLSAPQQPPKLN